MIVESKDRRSVKDLIESLGVPHVEVDLILVNEESVNFSYIIQKGDRISVYPEFEVLDVSGLTGLRPQVQGEPRFILDVHLRKLAKFLRLLGFDVDYRENRDDPELAEISFREKRILLTRDRQLLKRKIVDCGFIIRNMDAEKQVLEALDRFDLWSCIRTFTRCIECNGIVEPLAVTGAEFEKKKRRIPAGVLLRHNEFFLCDSCGRIYWKGSHYDKLLHMIDRITASKKQ